MTVIIILAALIALAWYLSKKFVAPKDSTFEFGLTEEDIINDIPVIETPKMAAKKSAKPKNAKPEFPIGDHHETIKKPKRKYNKKPKA
jgi:hypothetical protein